VTVKCLADCGVSELLELLAERETTSVSVAEACLDRIERTNEALNAFVVWNPEAVLARASELDRLADEGRSAGLLHGIPVAVKDNYLTSDLPTTAGSRVRHNRDEGQPEAAAVRMLREQGALIIGKTNMHEWAYGATNEHSATGRTRNPWDLSRITGGSSGGSGAALAARVVPAALGSDTGGSVRIPAAACGVSGLKPSYGLVDVTGVLPLAWSFDVAGPMARSASDLRCMLGVLTGTSSIKQRCSLEHNLRIGRLTGPGMESSSEVAEAVDAAVEVFESLGAIPAEVEVNAMPAAFGAWKVILHAEAATYHNRLIQEQADSYSRGVRIQLEAGRLIAATDYLQAQRFRREFQAHIEAILRSCDVLAMPTLPICAPLAGEEAVAFDGVATTPQDAMTRLPYLANFTGLPAVSIPCGFGEATLPIGFTLVGRQGTDYQLLDLAEAFQDLTNWHRLAPELASLEASTVGRQD